MVLIVVILLHYVFMNCEENILRLNVFFECTNDFVLLDISELKRRNSIFHNFN